MAYLGYSGIVMFQRIQPEPVVIPASAVNKSNHYINVNYDDWLLAEFAYLFHNTGTISGYVHRDALDRIYFHSNRDGALENSVATRISLTGVDVTKPVIIAATPSAAQILQLTSFQVTLTTITAERRLRAWPADWNAYKAAAEASPYQVQGELKRWQFSRNAPEVDISAIGDRFSTFTKATVSGSGTMDFIVRFYGSDIQKDIDYMLKLVQLTEHGCIGKARFYLKQATVEANDYVGSPVSAALYFDASILITTSAIDVDNSDVVLGSASFVTTGPIRLLSSQS